MGMKLGLENIRNMLIDLGNPHLQIPTIHIAGTNGKGSVASIIAKTLEKSGYKTGINTSPHLMDYRERFRINGKMISEEKLVHYIEELKPYSDKHNCTFFEISTALAALYFKDEKVDFGVFEVGLGGRLDASNLIKPEISVITNIGLDHTKTLGDTLEKIAAEKAGIIKNGVPVIIGNMDKGPEDVIVQTAEERGAELFKTKEVYLLQEYRPDCMILKPEKSWLTDINEMRCGLIGVHQVENYRTAGEALRVLKEKYSGITEYSAAEGFSAVHWPGRFHIIEKNDKTYIFDGAHNYDGMKKFVETLRNYLEPGEKINVVTAIFRDKDSYGMLLELKPYTNKLFLSEADTERATEIAVLEETAEELKIPYKSFDTIEEAVHGAEREDDGRKIIIAGSLYTVGDGMKAVKADIDQI